jgi:hypothetical protein
LDLRAALTSASSASLKAANERITCTGRRSGQGPSSILEGPQTQGRGRQGLTLGTPMKITLFKTASRMRAALLTASARVRLAAMLPLLLRESASPAVALSPSGFLTKR